MVALISILLAISMLALTVYGLHKYQNMEFGLSAERSIPLPPLDNIDGDGDSRKQPISIELEAADSISEAPSKQQADNWVTEVSKLKSKGNLEGALAICHRALPLWSAYNQTCIILRSQLKQLEAEDPRFDSILKELYRTAGVAELLHEKSPSSNHLSLTQLKQLSLEAIIELNLDYTELGYANLRLIRKSDVKLMLSQWGRPAHHTLPRTLHQDWWGEFTRNNLA